MLRTILIILFTLMLIYYLSLKFSSVEGMSTNKDGNEGDCKYHVVNKKIDELVDQFEEIGDMIKTNADNITQMQTTIESMSS